MEISSFIFDSYSINLCLGYQLCLICLLIPLYFSIHLHRHPGIFLPNVWTLPSESCLPFCLEQEYSYLCGQGGDVTHTFRNSELLDVRTQEETYVSHHESMIACLQTDLNYLSGLVENEEIMCVHLNKDSSM